MERGNQKNSIESSGKTSQQNEDRLDLFADSKPAAATVRTATPTKRQGTTIFSGENRFVSVLSKRRVLPIAIAAFILVSVGSIFAGLRINNSARTDDIVNSEQETVDLADANLSDLPQVLAESIYDTNRVTVNGPLEINDRLTITPSERPENARPGQLYFDANLGRFVFYDGSNYRMISSAQELNQLQTQVEGQILQNTDALEGRIGQTIAAAISRVQDAREVELIAGEGIRVDGYRISNSGVISLQGTANQISVSASTGNISISLPQDIHTEATPSFAGINLAAALGIDHGGTGSTSASYTTNGLLFYNGTNMSTVAANQPGMCLVSTAGAPTFSLCGDIIANSAVTSLNGLIGPLTISNVTASGSSLTLHQASQTQAGIINTVSQRIAGLKTFTGGIELGLSADLTAQGNLNILQSSFGNLVLGNSTGNVILPGLDCSATGNGGKLTLDANSTLMCATDTGGDGVGITSISASNSSIVVDNTDGDNPKVAVNVRDGSGLSTNIDGLGLLDSCSDGQTLKFIASTNSWVCADDNDSLPTNDCPTCVALQTETPGTAQDGHINITGTIISGGNQVNGQVLIKNLTDTVEAFDLQNVSGASLIEANTLNMKVTIGSLASPSTSELTGELPTGPSTYALINSGSTPLSAVAVSGDYAFVTTASSFFYVLDVSDPSSNPEVVLARTSGSGLTNPIKMIVNGSYLYILDKPSSSTGSLRVFNISDPTDPELIKSVATGNYPVDMVQNGNYIFIVSDESGSFGNDHIYTFDISDPDDPVQSADFVIGAGPAAWPTSITAHSTNIFITERTSNRIMSFDASNPNDITALGTTSTNAGPADISIYGSRAYVINSNAATMQTYDISDPSSMILRDTTEAGEIYSSPTVIQAHAGYVIITTYYGGPSNSHGYLQLYSTSNPDNPVLTGSKALLRRGQDMVLHNGVAYVANTYPSQNSLQTIVLGGESTTLEVYGSSNITGSLKLGDELTANKAVFSNSVTASNITALNTVQTQGLDSAIINGSVNIGSTYANAINLNQNTTIAVGKSLSVGGSTSITTDSATALEVKDSSSNSLLLVDASGMNIEIGSENAPTENTDIGGSIPNDGSSGSINISSLPNAVAASGNYAYVASSIMRKLQIVDVSQSDSPTLAGHVATAGDARAVHISGNRAYLALHPNTVEIYDISDKNSPNLLGSFTTQNAASSIHALTTKDNHVLVAYTGSASPNYGFIDSVDVTNPAATIYRSTKTLVANAKEIRMALVGDKLYLVYEGNPTSYSGMRVLNVSNPAAANLPHTNHNMNGASPSGGIAVHGDYAFVPFNNDSTLKVYNISAISGSGVLTPATSVSITSGPSDITISESGKYAYITSETANNLQILNISDPLAPQSLGTVDVSSGSGSAKTVAVAAANGRAYTVNNTRSNLVITDLAGSAPRIALNQNTVLSSGRTLLTQGITTVKTNSATAFRVQNAAGDDVLVIDTEEGKVVAGVAYAVGSKTGADITCEIGESLNNIEVTGGIITGGTCGDGTGEGGGSEGSLQVADGVFTPSVDTITEDGTLNIGSQNAGLVSINQNTEFAEGKTVSVAGDTSVATTSETAFVVSDTNDTQYIVVDTQNGSVKIGAPKAPPTTDDDEPGANFTVPASYSGRATMAGQPYDMATQGTIAYISQNYDNKLVAYDVSGVTPVEVASLDLTKPERMTISGDYLYVLTDDQIYIIDISIPSEPALVHTTNKFSFMGLYEDVAANDTTLYILTDSRQLLSFNITSPTSAALLSSRGNTQTSSSIFAVANKNDYFYLADNSSNLIRAYTGTNSINPDGSSSTNTKPTGLAVYGNYAYVVSSPANVAPGELEVFDISTPNTPTKVAELPTGNWPIDISISQDGSFATIVNYNSTTVQIVDITDPTRPVSAGFAATGTAPIVSGATADKALVATISNRYLESFDIEPVEPAPPVEPEPEYGITLDSNVTSSQGSVVKLQGETTVTIDSEKAFRVQDSEGTNIFRVDTVNGNIIAAGGLESAELSVSGEADLGSLSVQDTASFLANIIVNGHIITGGDAPSASELAAAGISASCVVAGNDTSGTITFTAGSSDATSGDVCQLTFSSAFEQSPRPIISGLDEASSSLRPYASATTTTLLLGIADTPEAAAEYKFNYWNPQ